MQILSFQIKNFKCFEDTPVVHLTTGINLVLGRNNVGKTALLEALQKPPELKDAHKTLTSSHSVQRKPEITFELNGSSTIINQEIYSSNKYHIDFPNQSSEAFKIFLVSLKNERTLYAKVMRSEGNLVIKTEEILSKLREEYGGNVVTQYTFSNITKDNAFYLGNGARGENLIGKFADRIFAKMYRFKAERLNIHEAGYQSNLELTQNANNLASALMYLYTSNRARHDKLCGYVHDIFSNVHYVSIVPKKENPNSSQILVWPVDPDTEMSNLCIPLSECGTGIGQVLAILFVILTSDEPRIILIDEPNSFLHPGAAKKLIEIMKLYPQHQYVISTHSPEIIKCANAKNILLLTQQDGKTNIEKIDLDVFEDQNKYLKEIGVSLSDVLSADRVLWVEGTTEEICFPIIFSGEKMLPLGTSILSVVSTGDFQQKNKKDINKILNIYRKLSGSTALVPRAVGFLFDKEGLSDADIQKQTDEFKESVKFLKRKMYENYLIDCDAILNALNKLPTFLQSPLSLEEVRSWIEAHGKDQKYINQRFSGEIWGEGWLEKVDGAKLLADLYTELSNEKEVYNKVRDGKWLTTWLKEHKADAFLEIEQVVNLFFKYL